MGESSSGRKWLARALLALAGIGIIAKVLMVLEAVLSGNSLALARQFDITNPSLIGIVWPISLIAYFFVRSGPKPASSGAEG
jgi:hypothetical protein